jgi:hypothetical protein
MEPLGSHGQLCKRAVAGSQPSSSALALPVQLPCVGGSLTGRVRPGGAAQFRR